MKDDKKSMGIHVLLESDVHKSHILSKQAQGVIIYGGTRNNTIYILQAPSTSTSRGGDLWHYAINKGVNFLILFTSLMIIFIDCSTNL